MTRRPTRADVVCAAGAAGLLVASFLPQSYDIPGSYGAEDEAPRTSLWQLGALVPLVVVVLVSVALSAAVLASPQHRGKPMPGGLTVEQWRAACAVLGALVAVLGLVAMSSVLYGAYVLAISAVVVAFGAAGAAYLPALRAGVGGPATGVDVPFWFAVDVPRPLYRADSPNSPEGTLNPGVWHLALARHGAALLVRTPDGQQGLLYDTDNLARG